MNCYNYNTCNSTSDILHFDRRPILGLWPLDRLRDLGHFPYQSAHSCISGDSRVNPTLEAH